MVKKIIGWVVQKLWPYWCPLCDKRYRSKEKFHKHYLAERPGAIARVRFDVAAEQRMRKIRIERARRNKNKRLKKARK